MWFPDQTLHTSIFAGLSLCHRQSPFIGPYLRCTFTMQHQFVCDTIATTTSLSNLVLHQLEAVDQFDTDAEHELSAQTKKLHCQHSKSPLSQRVLPDDTLNSCPANGASCISFVSVPKQICRVLGSASRLFHPYLVLTYLTFAAYWPSLWADLVFDDRPAIIENKDLRWQSSWSQLWSNDYWGTSLKSVCINVIWQNSRNANTGLWMNRATYNFITDMPNKPNKQGQH